MEQKTDAPERRNRDNHKHDPAPDGKLPAEDPTDNIKTEKPDGTPVQPAYNEDRQSNFVQQ
jgi:hypothetical protein